MKKIIRMITDIAMTVCLVILMTLRFSNTPLHEWTGIVFGILFIVHQVLNYRWYTVLFKGKYTLRRTIQTIVNLGMLVCVILTIACGMLMSESAVPFLRVSSLTAYSRNIHLCISHWLFLFAGIHIGMHVPAMIRKASSVVKRVLFILGIVSTVYGLYLMVQGQVFAYMFLQVQYAFADYTIPAGIAVVQTFIELISIVFITYLCMFISGTVKKH